jgi:hypothetical protein
MMNSDKNEDFRRNYSRSSWKNRYIYKQK